MPHLHCTRQAPTGAAASVASDAASASAAGAISVAPAPLDGQWRADAGDHDRRSADGAIRAPAVRAQRPLAPAWWDPGGPLPWSPQASDGSESTQRLARRRSQELATLVAAIEEAFPVVRALVGDDFFRAMAFLYVCDHRPGPSGLAGYGEPFADWATDFEPASAVPYLADMARLEYACVRAWHAADAAPLAQAQREAALARLDTPWASPLRLHPSVQALRSDFAVASLWSAHQAATADERRRAIAGLAVDTPEAAIVLRDGDAVLVCPCDASAAAFVDALQRGLPFRAALDDVALHGLPGLDPAATFSWLIEHGALVAPVQPQDAQAGWASAPGRTGADRRSEQPWAP